MFKESWSQVNLGEGVEGIPVCAGHAVPKKQKQEPNVSIDLLKKKYS
jgi:hypothetical protein